MPNSICSIAGCNSTNLAARGWCRKHYRRWQRHGDPLTTQQPTRGLYPICTIEDCTKPASRRTWCEMHYERWRSNGDPGIVRLILGDDLARFNAKVQVTPDCWIWMAGHEKRFGYPSFVFNGQKQGAHRFAYEYFIGPIPAGLEIDHRCHNHGCVNPAHLQAVTAQFNSGHRDCGRSGRSCWHPLQFPGRVVPLAI